MVVEKPTRGEGELVLTPEAVRKKIDSDWRRFNFSAETGMSYFFPFAASDVVGSKVKASQELHPRRSAEDMAKLLGLQLDGSIEGKRILSVGSGECPFGARARELEAQFTDLDLYFNPIGGILPVRGSEPLVARGEKLPFDEGTFDEVVLSFVLCAVDNPREMLEEAIRAAAPGGRIRIYPVVAFTDLRGLERGGMKVFRRGMDNFTVVMEKDRIPDIDAMVDLLLNSDHFCVKPDSTYLRKKVEGYYYDVEHDRPEEEWWLGDEE